MPRTIVERNGANGSERRKTTVRGSGVSTAATCRYSPRWGDRFAAIEDPREGVPHVGGGERPPVVEPQPRPQVEYIRQGIGRLPPRREIGEGFAGGVASDEGGVRHLEDLLAVGVGRHPRVDVHGRPRQRDHQPPLVDRQLLRARGKRQESEEHGEKDG